MPFTSDQIAKLMSLIGDKPGNGIQANMADSEENQHITSSNIVLFDVLVIPKYCVSLLSVNKMVRESKLYVGFDEYDCIIQDLKKKNISGTSSEAGGLYVFNTEFMSVLINRLSIGKPTYAIPCEVCHHAKQVREPFPLTIVDDYSKAVDVKFYETIFPYKMSSKKDKCLVKNSSEIKMFSENDDATSHKTFFDDFQTDIQASSPNDDRGEPSGINIGSESDLDDTAKEIMIKNQCREVKKTSLR
ncbi:hypothetical protein Tco_1520885, partial [Tanacetum coccineum]